MKFVAKCTLFSLIAFACAVTAFADRDPMSLGNLPMDSIQQYAKDGDCNAQYLLAERLLQGNKIAKDTVAAFTWMDQAARCGNKWAMDEMGVYYCFSRKNTDSGLYWIEKAADLQVGRSQTLLGAWDFDNAETEDDSIEAYMWVRLGVLNSGGDISRDALDSLKTKIRPQTQTLGDSAVFLYLTECLRNAKTESDSLSFTNLLAEIGSPEALFIRGTSAYNDAKLMYDIFAVPEDSSKLLGLNYIRQAAEKGYAPAQAELGVKYFSHAVPGVTNTYDSALAWYTKAVAQGDPRGEVELGFMYCYGFGVKKNPKEALRLYKLSAAQNLTQGIFYLGDFYWSDNASKKNPIRAHALLDIASSRGSQVDTDKLQETLDKMNDKQKAESEQIEKELSDSTKIKAIIESWVD